MKRASFHTLGCKLNYTETITLGTTTYTFGSGRLSLYTASNATQLTIATANWTNRVNDGLQTPLAT